MSGSAKSASSVSESEASSASASLSSVSSSVASASVSESSSSASRINDCGVCTTPAPAEIFAQFPANEQSGLCECFDEETFTLDFIEHVGETCVYQYFWDCVVDEATYRLGLEFLLNGRNTGTFHILSCDELGWGTDWEGVATDEEAAGPCDTGYIDTWYLATGPWCGVAGENALTVFW